MKYAFNTHRQYSADGQLIEAEIVNDGERYGILFNDVTRCIRGFFPVHRMPETEQEMRHLVMIAYDHNLFELQ